MTRPAWRSRPGVEHHLLLPDPRRLRARARAPASSRSTSPTTSSYTACRAMSPGVPRVCMSTTGTPFPATSSAMAGSARAETSFTRSAPAASAARATSAFRVSTEMGVVHPASRSRSMTGTTRAALLVRRDVRAPGRVDSPPRSSRSAPSETSRSACSTAAAGSRKRPPSENESGVTFTTPMRKGPAPEKTRAPMRRAFMDPSPRPSPLAGRGGMARAYALPGSALGTGWCRAGRRSCGARLADVGGNRRLGRRGTADGAARP